MDARAIIIEPCKRLDTNSVEKFGEVVFVFNGIDRRPSIWSEEFTLKILDKLNEINYDPHKDYLVLSGSVITLVKAVAAIADCYGCFYALCWNQTDQNYVSQELGGLHV